MPTATMTSAPKKKRDFYNSSQGLDLRDFRSPEPQEPQDEGVLPEGADVLEHERGPGGSYPPGSPLGCSHSQAVGGHSSDDYFFPAPIPSRHSPADYYSQAPQDRSPPLGPGFGLPSRGLEFDDSAPLAGASGSYSSGSADHQPWGSSQQPPLGDDDGDGDDGKKRGAKKRKQRCRMCANHGIYVEIKGHKWHCHYKNPQHNCDKCDITRKRQYYMAKQAGITRMQQQEHHMPLQGGLEGEELLEGCSQAAMSGILPSQPSDFPRMKELLEETDGIVNEDFFRQVDECVRLKVTHH